MRTLCALVVLTLLFSVPAESISQEAKNDESAFVELPIFEYTGLVEALNCYGVMGFEVLINKDNLLTKKKLLIWPADLQIEIRKDKQPVTTLRVRAKYGDKMPLEELVDRAVLLVPDKDDWSRWEKYREEQRSVMGQVNKSALIFSDGVFRVSISTNIGLTIFGAKGVSITELSANLQNVEVLKYQGGRTGDPVYFSARWLRIWKGDAKSKWSAVADRLDIQVPTDDLFNEWEKRLKYWREKTGPHRVLPPGNP